MMGKISIILITSLTLLTFKGLAQTVVSGFQEELKLYYARQELVPGIIKQGDDDKPKEPNYSHFVFISHQDEKPPKIEAIWVAGFYYKVKLTTIVNKFYNATYFDGMKMDSVTVVEKSANYLSKIELVKKILPTIRFKNLVIYKRKQLKGLTQTKTLGGYKIIAEIKKSDEEKSQILFCRRLIEIPSNVTQ